MVYGLDPNSSAIWIEHVALSYSQKPMNRISSIHPSIQLPGDRFAKKRNATRKKKTTNKKTHQKTSDVTNNLAKLEPRNRLEILGSEIGKNGGFNGSEENGIEEK